MEPISAISLISSCASLTKTCISVSKTLSDLADKYKHAELSILSLAEECNTIQLAWARIERWASQNLDNLDDFGELKERLPKSIYTGNLVMSALAEDLKNLQSSTGTGLRRKTRLVWNDTAMRDHQHRLRGQVTALTLLLGVLQLPAQSDRVEVFTIKESVFNAADDSVRAIIPSQMSQLSTLRRSIDSYESTELRYKPLAFENDLFTSYVYKRNFRIPSVRNVLQIGQSSLSSSGRSQRAPAPSITSKSTHRNDTPIGSRKSKNEAAHREDASEAWVTASPAVSVLRILPEVPEPSNNQRESKEEGDSDNPGSSYEDLWKKSYEQGLANIWRLPSDPVPIKISSSDGCESSSISILQQALSDYSAHAYNSADLSSVTAPSSQLEAQNPTFKANENDQLCPLQTLLGIHPPLWTEADRPTSTVHGTPGEFGLRSDDEISFEISTQEFMSSYSQYFTESDAVSDRVELYRLHLQQTPRVLLYPNHCILGAGSLPPVDIPEFKPLSWQLILSVYCADLIGYQTSLALLKKGANPCHLLFGVACLTREDWSRLRIQLDELDGPFAEIILKFLALALGSDHLGFLSDPMDTCPDRLIPPPLSPAVLQAAERRGLANISGAKYSVLQLACYWEESEIVRHMLRMGKLIIPNDWRNHPFIFAVDGRSVDTLRYLLEHAKEMDSQTAPETAPRVIQYLSLCMIVHGWIAQRPLSLCRGTRYIHPVQELRVMDLLLRYDALLYGTDPHFTVPQRWSTFSILHAAIMTASHSMYGYDLEILKWIVRHKVRIDTLEPWYTGIFTPLFFAISLWKPKVVEILLEAGARRYSHVDSSEVAKLNVELKEALSNRASPRHKVASIINAQYCQDDRI